MNSKKLLVSILLFLNLSTNISNSLENKIILKNVMKGGFVDYDFPDDYLNLLCSSVKKKHYVYHFRNVLSNFRSWVNVKKDYHKVKTPTKLIYGSNDWANEKNREESQKLLGLKNFEVIKNEDPIYLLKSVKNENEINHLNVCSATRLRYVDAHALNSAWWRVSSFI